MPEPKHGNSPESNDPAAEAPESSDTLEEPGDQQDGAEEEPSELAKVRDEAAKHRRRLREVEQERDGLLAQRDAFASTVLADALHGTGITPEAFAAAGRTVEEFVTEQGTLDRSALTAAAREVGKRFGSPGGRSPYTGTGEERPEKGKTWADAISK